MEILSELNTFRFWITIVSSKFLSDKGFKDIVLNRAMSSSHGGSLESTLTVPLRYFFFQESAKLNTNSSLLKVCLHFTYAKYFHGK